MTPQTPGWRTTEWWTTLSHVLFSALTVLGVVGTSDAGRLEGAVAVGVTAVFALVSTAWTVGAYVAGRTELKREAVAQEGAQELAQDVYPGGSLKGGT
jgi:hypothetical protein